MAIEINGDTGISGVNGSATTPAIQGTDTNTGLSFGTDEISLNTAGSERFRVGSAGQLGIGGATYGSSGQFLQSQGSGSAPQWATVSAGFTSSSVLTLSSNASVDFTIPADVNVVDLIARNFSSSGNDEIRVQIGDSSGVKTSSYRSGTSLVYSGSTTEIHSATAGWVLGTVEANRTYECQYRLRRMGNGRWHCSWNGMFNNSSNVLAGTVQGAGVAPSLNAGGLTTVRLAVAAGTFDDGDASVLYI